MRQFTFDDIHNLWYHQMLESDWQYMVHTMYTTSEGQSLEQCAVPGPGTKCRHQWQILSHNVCVAAFCDLLGTSNKKLYKDIKLAIDCLRTLDDAGPIHPRRTPQLHMCHHFFRALYTSAAEVLPTAAPGAEGDDEDSSQDASDELDGWTPERPLVDVIGDSVGDLDPAELTPRQLPLFSMSDLYWQFQAWFEVQHGNVHHVETDSDEDAEGDARPHPAGAKLPSRGTFSRAWRVWSKVLHLKFPSDHSCCQTCFELREATYRTWSPLHVKLQYARRWRDHLRDQYMDRVLYWNLRFASREFDSSVLTIIIDSMGK